MSDYEIKLVQKPIIQHQLLIVGESVTKRLSDLNIEKQLATDETIQALKNLRADLNKELSDFEAQRKAIKEAVLTPYNDLEVTYKQEISEKYKKAIDTLKDKIGEFEIKIKQAKQSEIKAYFNELCLAEEIDFVSFENMGVEINLSTSVKKYKEQAFEFIQRVKSDLELIATQEHEPEILVEYKKDLNVSRAIKTVVDRKEEEKKQAELLRMQEIDRREKILTYQCNMIKKDFVKAWVDVSDNSIVLSYDFVNQSSKEEFAIKIDELIAIVEAKKTTSAINITQPTAKPLSNPVVVQPETQKTKEEILTAEFRVKGTISQLTALNQYMKENNLLYENI